ncbi:hypothetical protein GOP47_0027080 [Adiantum capillus-veneris]|nr:hypothetical protein GOP47_0027080 [Adiantum capillus-veneris]
MITRQLTGLVHFRSASICLACESAACKGTHQTILPDVSDLIKNFRAQCLLGQLHEALQFLYHLEERRYQRSSHTYVCLLQGCIQSNALHEGRLLHSHLIKDGSNGNVFLYTTLANMYARCGCIEDSQSVFYGMPERNVVSWSMMIAAYCAHEKFKEALHVFWAMQKDGLTPDHVNFISAFKACAGLGDLKEGKRIHKLLKNCEIKPSTMLGNSLMNMYVKCGSVEDAQQVFDSMEERNAGSWSVMIGGYTKIGKAGEAMRLFNEMQSTDVEPDDVTFLSALNACAALGDLMQAKQIHACLKKSGVNLGRNTQNTLVDMYAKCGSLTEAWEVFDDILEHDIVTWNSMIAGISKHGHCEEALKLHGQMIIEGNLRDQVSFVSIINACTLGEDLAHGKQFHSQIAKTKGFINVFVENALVDMYAKCGSLTEARHLFDGMQELNVVSWNSILAGYGANGLDEEVLKLFEEMLENGVKPDELTYVRILNACATNTSLEQGLQLHHDILLSRYELDVYIGNALIDMYSKCGRIEDSLKVLNRMLIRDAISWNTLLAGFSQHGLGQEALQLMVRMLNEGAKLNHVSFVAILSACSHAGLVDEGRFYFSCMHHVHGAQQAVEHYGCMVDLLGRSGHLHEAAAILEETTLDASSIVLWKALLGACRIHGDVNLAAIAAERVLVMDPNEPGVLCLLSNIHASFDEGGDQATMITLMNDENLEEADFGSDLAYG